MKTAQQNTLTHSAVCAHSGLCFYTTEYLYSKFNNMLRHRR